MMKDKLSIVVPSADVSKIQARKPVARLTYAKQKEDAAAKQKAQGEKKKSPTP
jgi:hypothetical protein